MKNLNTLGLLGLMMGLVLLVPTVSQADPKADPAAGGPCAQHKDMDQLNLCRAFEIDKAKTEEQKENRYKNKNHTTYYCSLIKDRELQKFCFAVAVQTKSGCANLVDPKLEAECNSRIKD